MALIKCPECNNDISSEAIACPHCGKTLAKGKHCPMCSSFDVGRIGVSFQKFPKTYKCKTCGYKW
ncbi:MAG: zinc ribbon domain-containing protein [Christensenellales bacterium]